LFLAVLIVGIAIVGLVVAYTTGWTGDPGSELTPPVTGHSADETNVWVNGAAKTLQQAIDDSDFAGGTGRIVGGGIQGPFSECWPDATCPGGMVNCPAGSTKRITGWSDSGFGSPNYHILCMTD